MLWVMDLPLGIVPNPPSSPIAPELMMGSSVPTSEPKISVSTFGGGKGLTYYKNSLL